MDKFFLGTHIPAWVYQSQIGNLFISRRRLFRYINTQLKHRAINSWALDSGGFSELSIHGQWTVSVDKYLDEIMKCAECVGNLEFAVQQDWMCEPFILKKTGKTVKEHQDITVQNFIEMKEKSKFPNILPVIQGFAIHEYMDHIDSYAKYGIFLEKFPLVGVGSVCRRQNTAEITQVIKSIFDRGISIHGFGMKKDGIINCKNYIKSSDSMAWSRNARFEPPLPGCLHKNCANCKKFAIKWMKEILNLF